MRSLRLMACALAAASAGGVPALAAPCTGEDCAASVLEEIVVTARRAPRIVFESSETIGVIDRAELERSTAYGLADAMRSMPGVQVSDSGQPVGESATIGPSPARCIRGTRRPSGSG